MRALPFMRKRATVYAEIRHRLCGAALPFMRGSATVYADKKSATVYAEASVVVHGFGAQRSSQLSTDGAQGLISRPFSCGSASIPFHNSLIASRLRRNFSRKFLGRVYSAPN